MEITRGKNGNSFRCVRRDGITSLSDVPMSEKASQLIYLMKNLD